MKMSLVMSFPGSGKLRTISIGDLRWKLVGRRHGMRRAVGIKCMEGVSEESKSLGYVCM